jgi:ribosome-associated protein
MSKHNGQPTGYMGGHTGNHAEKSRSRKKRESTALQKRGEELAALGPGSWKTLPLPEGLLEALSDLHRMKNHEARRRQMQYLGRLMREADSEEMDTLLSALDDLQPRAF